MALIKCPDCAHDVSTSADRCPNCGWRVDLDAVSAVSRSPQEQPSLQPASPQPIDHPRAQGNKALLVVVLLFACMILYGISQLSGTSTPSTQRTLSRPTVSSAGVVDGPRTHTVSYAVEGTGSYLNVTYRNASGGSDETVVPKGDKWRTSVTMKTADFASVHAQLSGGGTVTCELLVDGVSVDGPKTSSGGNQIASCSARVP